MGNLKRCYTVYGLLLSACSSFGVVAQDKTLSEEDLFDEIPMVSIASRLDQPAHLAPASVTIIDRELIDASGAQNWGDLFRLVPGFQSYAVNDNRPGIAYHGFGEEFPNRLEVMVDGRSVYQPVFSTVIWSTLGIQLEDVDHIEIVRGPSAASQGSNAFLGAVNIITRHPVQDQGASVRITGGSRDTRNTWVRVNDSIGPLNFRLSLGSRINNGFPNTPEGELDDGRELYQAAFRGTMTPSLNDVLDVNFGYADDRVGFGDADHPDEYIETNYYSAYQSAKWLHTLNSGGEFSIHGYHNSLKGRSSTDRGLISEFLGVAPELVSRTLGIPDQRVVEGFGGLSSERFDLEFEHKLASSTQFRTVWGLGGRSEYTRNALLQGHDSKIWEESYRWFAHNEWRPSAHWMLNTGLMIEKTFVGTLASPRLSLSHLLSQNHTLRMSISRGRRAPSITEANLDQKLEFGGVIFNAVARADSDLDEEKITTVEVAWAGYFPDWHLGLDINLFREQARDTIEDFSEGLATLTPIGDDLVNVKSNNGEWDTKGLELQLIYRPTSRTLARLNYTYLDLESEYVQRLEPTKVVRDFNDSRPRHTGALLLNYEWAPGLTTGLTTYHQSETDWRDGNFIDEYTRLDSHVSFEFIFRGHSARLQLVAQNITQNYSEFNEANLFESRYFVSVSLDLP